MMIKQNHVIDLEVIKTVLTVGFEIVLCFGNPHWSHKNQFGDYLKD